MAAQLQGLTGADRLESTIRTLIMRFNRKRVARNVAVQPDGSKHVRNAKFLLLPLFQEVEFNLASSRTQSGLSPFAPASPPGTARFSIPPGFFLRHELFGGRSLQGLRLTEAGEFNSLPDLPLQEYINLVTDQRVGLLGLDGSNLQLRTPADADFVWFTPERAFVDDHLIDRLLRGDVVTPEFVAAVCRVDLKQPLFSVDLRTIFETDGLLPETYIVPATQPANHRDHPLTKHVLGFLSANPPAAGSVLARFGMMLNADDPLGDLRSDIVTYAQEVKNGLSGVNASEVLKELFSELLARRRGVINDPQLRRLDETLNGSTSLGLLPLPIPSP